jgi:hypothetical protein
LLNTNKFLKIICKVKFVKWCKWGNLIFSITKYWLWSNKLDTTIEKQFRFQLLYLHIKWKNLMHCFKWNFIRNILFFKCISKINNNIVRIVNYLIIIIYFSFKFKKTIIILFHLKYLLIKFEIFIYKYCSWFFELIFLCFLSKKIY